MCLSIDDLYLPRAKQQALTDANPDNPLLAQRGQPGTHDLGLGSELFTALKERRRSVKIPKYDKSAYHGKGDRVDESHWDEINRDDESKIRIVLFEGWCVGFRPLRREELESRWQQARNELQDAGSLEETQSLLQDPRQRGRLGRHRFEDVKTVNECLYAYDELTECVKRYTRANVRAFWLMCTTASLMLSSICMQEDNLDTHTSNADCLATRKIRNTSTTGDLSRRQHCVLQKEVE